jgi:glycerophosphoryl diester phosphodiesterase
MAEKFGLCVNRGETMVLRIGHRGAAGHAPENTLASLEKGIALGANFVEFDVQLTRDGHLVLIHDRMVDRTTNGKGIVSEMNLQDLRKLDAGDGQILPLLDEALRVANRRAGVVIELKIQGIAKQVCTAVEQHGFISPVIYASFFHPELLEVRKTLRNAQTLALLEGMPVDPTSFATDAQATHVGLAVDSISPSFVETLHSEGLQVFVYTANHPLEIQRMKSLGVEGIISDFPERI